MKIILASTSPRRAQILRDAGFEFETHAPQVIEQPGIDESPRELVARLALEKARAVAKRVAEPATIIGADTAIIIDGKQIGKPVDVEDAGRILRVLSGRTHEVVTGLAVIAGNTTRVEHEVTLVTFAKLSEPEIGAYVASEEPFDKAGAYAIQGIGGRYVSRIEGCYFNVMGLPLARLYRILHELRVM
jgi:septum formation protein